MDGVLPVHGLDFDPKKFGLPRVNSIPNYGMISPKKIEGDNESERRKGTESEILECK
jgi:hypothetical protein